mmetsp:Transcript_7399/g.10500  ORF Transcript_7399/g.10500 Transcript_7399/m.10500 type:complete len:366 (-) Transcript_7399:74-1171(-)
MQFSSNALSAIVLAATGFALCSETATAFAPSRAFIPTNAGVSILSNTHQAGCACNGCVAPKFHPASCPCGDCASSTRLYADVAEETVPAEVEAMDGIDSPEEAHNEERKDNRGSLKKHKRGPKGTPISELEVGSTISGKVKTIASYGAFVDIGASTDGLLHISRLSAEYVADVNEILSVGQEIEVRIANVDAGKNQVALSMISEEEEKAAARPQRERAPRQQRRDDSAITSALEDKGFDSDQFVEGEVVSTVDFGAFVRVDASTLNSEVEGSMDGLVHISCLAAGRTNNVSDIVSVGDKVQVRLKGIQGNKVSLSMIKEEDEQPRGGRNAEPVVEGAKDWKESLERIQSDMASFENKPLVVDNRA